MNGQNVTAVILDEVAHVDVPTTPIYGPDGKLIPVEDKLLEAKVKLTALDASQSVLNADATLGGFGRREWRNFVNSRRQSGDGSRENRVSKRRAKNRVAKKSRKANR